jgi:hypothetical protein
MFSVMLVFSGVPPFSKRLPFLFKQFRSTNILVSISDDDYHWSRDFLIILATSLVDRSS